MRGAFEKKVEASNRRGGASEEEYEALQREQATLNIAVA